MSTGAIVPSTLFEFLYNSSCDITSRRAWVDACHAYLLALGLNPSSPEASAAFVERVAHQNNMVIPHWPPDEPAPQRGIAIDYAVMPPAAGERIRSVPLQSGESSTFLSAIEAGQVAVTGTRIVLPADLSNMPNDDLWAGAYMPPATSEETLEALAYVQPATSEEALEAIAGVLWASRLLYGWVGVTSLVWQLTVGVGKPGAGGASEEAYRYAYAAGRFAEAGLVAARLAAACLLKTLARVPVTEDGTEVYHIERVYHDLRSLAEAGEWPAVKTMNELYEEVRLALRDTPLAVYFPSGGPADIQTRKRNKETQPYRKIRVEEDHEQRAP